MNNLFSLLLSLITFTLSDLFFPAVVLSQDNSVRLGGEYPEPLTNYERDPILLLHNHFRRDLAQGLGIDGVTTASFGNSSNDDRSIRVLGAREMYKMACFCNNFIK